MMASTTAVEINWVRSLSANLARATSTSSIVLLTIAISKSIGYTWGVAFSSGTAVLMVLIWVWGYPVVFDTLRGWLSRVKTWLGRVKMWCKAALDRVKVKHSDLSTRWETTKQSLKQGWDGMIQRVTSGWDVIKQRVGAAQSISSFNNRTSKTSSDIFSHKVVIIQQSNYLLSTQKLKL